MWVVGSRSATQRVHRIINAVTDSCLGMTRRKVAVRTSSLLGKPPLLLKAPVRKTQPVRVAQPQADVPKPHRRMRQNFSQSDSEALTDVFPVKDNFQRQVVDAIDEKMRFYFVGTLATGVLMGLLMTVLNAPPGGTVDRLLQGL